MRRPFLVLLLGFGVIAGYGSALCSLAAHSGSCPYAAAHAHP